MENIVYRAQGDSTLCAVYDTEDRLLLAKPESHSPLKWAIEREYLYVSLGVDAMFASDWEHLRPTIKGIIEANISAIPLPEAPDKEQLIAEIRDAESAVFETSMDSVTPLVSAVFDDESDLDNIVIDYSADSDTAGISLRIGNAEAEEIATVSIHMTDKALTRLAQDIEHQFSLVSEYRLVDVYEALGEVRETLRNTSDQWGNLSPYLEQMLADKHPQVRLKNQGKYNPDDKRIILLHVHPSAGEGGWEPALLDESDKAHRQWDDAGISYPQEMRERAARRKTREIVESMRKPPQQGRISIEEDVVTLIAQQREITHQLAESQTAYRDVVANGAYRKVLSAAGSVRNSRALDKNGQYSIMLEALRQVGVHIQKLSLLPATELDNSLLQGLKTTEEQGSLSTEYVKNQLDAAERLIAQLAQTCDDDAIELMSRSLDKLSELCCLDTSPDKKG